MAVQFFGRQAQVEERGRHRVTGMVGDQNQGAGAIGVEHLERRRIGGGKQSGHGGFGI